MCDNYRLTRPPLLILIDAPFSSELSRHTIDEQGQYLGSVIRGHFAYYAVPTNGRLLSAFRYRISVMWFQSLRRRSQRHRLTWERMCRLIEHFLPPPRVLHPWPDQRFRVTHSR
jgi:RNA-directed DNA polymerase